MKGFFSADESSGERPYMLSDLKGIPKYRNEAVKYWAGLSRRLILYKVLYWLLRLHMGQLYEQEGRIAVQSNL